MTVRNKNKGDKKRKYRKGVGKSCQIVLTKTAYRKISYLSRGTKIPVKELASKLIMATDWVTVIDGIHLKRRKIAEEISKQE